MTSTPVNAHDHLLSIWGHPKCQRMFINFALRYGFDIDDIIQDGYVIGCAALGIYRRLAGDDQALPSQHYLVKAMQNGLFGQLRERFAHNGGALHCCSLDDPLHEEDGEDSSSRVPQAPDLLLSPADDSRAIAREQALYAALEHLHPEEQAFICERHDLYAFEVKGDRTTDRRRSSVRQNAYRRLRKNARLKEVVLA